MCLFYDEDPLVKFKKTNSAGKQVVASLFGIDGHVATVSQVERRTVDADWYTSVCLPKVFQSSCEGRLHIHHSNASVQTAAVTGTLDFLAENGV